MKQFTLYSLLFTLYSLLFAHCDKDPLLERTGADYLPLAQENTWIYRAWPKDTITIKVTGTANIAQREAWIIERNGSPTYWWKSDRRIDKFYCETVFFDGKEDTVFQAWLPWLHLPFVLGERKSYSFAQETTLPQDTILTQLQMDYEVTALYSQEYQIEIRLIKTRHSQNSGSYSDTTTYEEQYAPGIGMTERKFGTTYEKLISYSLH